MAGVCTGPGPCDVAPLGTGNNWVTKAGGLPLYIRAVAHALRRSGHSESESIQLAVGTVQRWARGGGKVTAGTRARAAAALAEWERKRAEAHLSGSDAVSIDLAYQWKHGWIPLTPAALAIKLGKSHGHAEGIKANDARKALGTHKDFRAGFEKGRADVKGHSYSPGDLRDQARKHEAAASSHLQHAGDSFYPDATKDATREAGHAAALRHEAMLSQRRFHRSTSEPLHVRKDDGSMGTADNKTSEAVRRYQKRNPNVPHVQLSRTDLAFDPSESRGVTGQWTTGSSGSAPGTLNQQAAAAGVDPAVLAAVAKSLGLTPGQVSLMAQQSKAAKAKKSSSGGSGGGGASKAAAGKTQTARIAALKKAKAAYTAATKLEAQTTMAERAPNTKASDAKAAALNALPPDQRALFAGSVPPAGYAWTTGGKLVPSHSVGLSGGTVTTTVDLSQMLPDMDAVRKAAAKLSKLPPPLRKVAAARLAARAKQLGCTLNLATPMDLRAAARDKAKSAGATLPGTSSYPTQTRALFDKAVRAVGRGGADHDKIRAYLIKRASAEGWPTPDNWNSDGSLKDAAA